MAPYFGNFSGFDGMAQGFSAYNYETTKYEAPAGMCAPEQVLFASYGTPSYSGDAVVLFERDGKIFEVRGSHCSCNGLEGQWEPGEVTWVALALRDFSENGWLAGWNDHTDEAREYLKALVTERTR